MVRKMDKIEARYFDEDEEFFLSKERHSQKDI